MDLKNTRIILFLVHLCQLGCLVGGDAGVNDLLDIAVHDFVQLVQRQVDPVIGHTALGEVVRPDLLGTVTGTDLAPACLCLRIVGFLTLDIV